MLRILLLEDNAADAALVIETLAADELVCHCDRVISREQFVARLHGQYDLILSDYSLPGFDGITAQQIALEQRPDLPFVFVSGTIGEEVAIERLKAGATDYVLKHRLGRLASAVRRAVEEAKARRERDRAWQEVRRLNAELEQRVRDRTAELAQANRDLAQRELELRETTAFLDSLVENLPAVLFVKDGRTRRYLRFNRAGEDLLGRARGELVGRTDHELFAPEIADRFAESDRLILEQHAAHSEADDVFTTSDGGTRTLHTRKIPILDAEGRSEFLLGIAVDITERRLAEEAARAARLEAERANQAKSEFVSRMNHDLRTPLNAILGFAQVLEADGRLPADQHENARQILQGGLHLLGLINEILDLARIESGHLSLAFTPVDPKSMVDELTDLLQPLADARRISFVTDLSLGSSGEVLADRQRLKQVLLNLLGNAVKYNREGGRVTITSEVSPQCVRVWVRDTGRGIAPEGLSRLFEPFERLGAEQEEVEGTGLGLAVAKRLVEAMHGTIGVEPSDSGAAFWFELPRALPEGPRTTGTVLYVDDNPANVRLLGRLLALRTDVRLLAAGDGRTGLALAAEHCPDLILLDLHLPDMSGEDVLGLLRESDKTSGTPVVVLSADTTQAERVRKAGAQAYLSKPLILTDLNRVLDRYLRACA